MTADAGPRLPRHIGGGLRLASTACRALARGLAALLASIQTSRQHHALRIIAQYAPSAALRPPRETHADPARTPASCATPRTRRMVPIRPTCTASAARARAARPPRTVPSG